MIADKTTPLGVIADLEANARRVETPCGDGAMTWRIWGRGRPVVFLHGAHGSWLHFIRNIGPASEYCQVLAPDMPGYGESALPPDKESLESHAEAIAAGLDQIAEGEPLDIVAFSMSASVAAALAVMRPDLVRRLIIIDAGGLGTPHPEMNLRSARGLEGDEFKAVLRSNMLEMMIDDPANADDLAEYIYTVGVSQARSKAHFQILPDKLLQYLPRVDSQLDAIWADADRPHPDPDLHAELLRRFDPDLEMRVVPNSGHWVMYEGAEGFNKVLRDLLEKPLRR